MILSRSVLLVTFLLLTGCGETTAVSPLWGALEPGPYEIGFRVVALVDSTRGDTGTGGRSIETSLWYPALPLKEPPRLLFRDYVKRALRLGDFPGPNTLRDWLALAISGGVDAIGHDTLDLILNAPMQARQLARPRRGAFPLVLWTMRHETPVAQSVLSEYLASYGYVVASARYVGSMPLPWEIRSQEEKVHTFGLHLQDLNFTLESLARKPNVDASRAAILTWSYAAELAPRVQMQHPSVRLVIGLSSNPLSGAGVYQGADAASFLIPERLNATYVVMTERIGTDGKQRSAPVIMEQLPSESFYVSFAALAHGNFNTVEGMIPGVFDITTVQPWSKGGSVAQLGYETIARYVLYFLNQNTQRGARIEQDGRFWEAGLPADFVTVTRYGS